MKFSELHKSYSHVNEMKENNIVSVEELKKMLIDAFNINLFKPIKIYDKGNILNIEVTMNRRGYDYSRAIDNIFQSVWEKLDDSVYSYEYYYDSFNFIISKNGKEFLDFLIA